MLTLTMMLPFFLIPESSYSKHLDSSYDEESSAEVQVIAKIEPDSTKHEEADLVSKIFVSRFVFDV